MRMEIFFYKLNIIICYHHDLQSPLLDSCR